MGAVETKPITKSDWGEGPWQSEPDRLEFHHAGLPCIVLRHPELGHFCGYAAVPPGHPAHGKDYDSVGVEAHGGLTYADRCSGQVCHVPQAGESEDVWWLGFDCGHAFDFSPGARARLRSLGFDRHRDEVYRDIAYVRQQTESLAEQLQAMQPNSD